MAAKMGLASLILALSAETTVPISRQDPNIFSGVLIPQVAEAITRPILTEEQVAFLVNKYATRYHVKENSMMETIRCESPREPNGDYDPLGQSNIIGPDERREESYGLVQIHLPSHPKITLEQAQDPEFSIEFMAQEFSKGRAWKWTCWWILKRSGKI